MFSGDGVTSVTPFPYIMENTGLNVSQLYIAQVKRKYGLMERVNYNGGSVKSKIYLSFEFW